MTLKSEKASSAAASPSVLEPEHETDSNAHQRVEPEDRGPGMDEPVHYTYATADKKPPERDVRVCEAVKAGDRELVRRLVTEQKCSVHQRAEQDWTPLNFAAGKGDMAMVKLLVEELAADITAVGRDRRRPSAIARSARAIEVAEYLLDKEKALGLAQSHGTRLFCKAYLLKDLRKFRGWREERKNWTLSRHWTADVRAEFEKPLADDDAVFLHRDFVVTRAIWRDEHIIFDQVTEQWREFCKRELGFRIPAGLR